MNIYESGLWKKGTPVVSSMTLRRMFPRMPILGITTGNQRNPKKIRVRPVGRNTPWTFAAEFWRPATIEEVKKLFL